MSTETILPIDRNTIETGSQAAAEPEWMTRLRLRGLELAGSLELPRLEKTRIDRWNLDSFGSYKSAQPITSIDELPETAAKLLKPEGETLSECLIVQRNSNVVYSQLSEEVKKQGVVFASLQEALKTHGDIISNHFMQVIKADEHKLTALHSAMWSGGIFLYVPKNVQVEVPLQALFLTDDAEASLSPHILVIAEANSSVTYVDNFTSAGTGGPLVQNGIVEVVVKSGAKVNFASVHHFGEQVTDLTFRRALWRTTGRSTGLSAK